ncbi:MAG: TPM domain-containing protein, partial [Acutalibacteraceae bacterium]
LKADSENGILITDNLGGGESSIYLSGDAVDVITEQIKGIIVDAYDSNETYYGGIASYYAAVETVLRGGTYASPVTTPDGGTESATEFVPVERVLPLVVDNADLLTTEEENALCARLEVMAQEYEMEIAVLTVPSLDGKTSEEYADDFYDYNGYGYGENDDGMLILYKPGEVGNREIYISTHAKGSEAFYEDVRNNIIDAMIDDLKNENYASAFNTYADLAEDNLELYCAALADNNLDSYYDYTGSNYIPYAGIKLLIICVAFGMLAGFIIIKSIAGKNKSVRRQTNATVYTRPGSMVVTGSYDNFISKRVYKTPIPKSDDSSSDDSHTSSSGRSHSGSGRSF